MSILLDANASEDGGQKTKGTFCRLESMADVFRLIFRDNNSHAINYRVSPDQFLFDCSVSRLIFSFFYNITSVIVRYWLFGYSAIFLT